MGIFEHLTTRGRSNQGLREKGDAARDARSWIAAAAFYTRYLEHVPEDAPIWVQLGHARKESGDLTGAEQAYLRALSIEPGSPDTHVQLGHIEKLQGNLNQAFARYRKALALDPKFPPALEEFKGRDSEGTDPTEVSPAHSAVAKEIVVSLEKDLTLLAEQFNAVKAIAFEVQKLRRRADEFDQRLDQLTERVANLASKSDSAQTAIENRISLLEGQSPSVQGRFSALLEYFSAVTACRKDLDQHAALIDELMRRQNPA